MTVTRRKYHTDVIEWTPEILASRIKELIEEAKTNGVEVVISNECCGCSKMTLVACSGTYGEPDHKEVEILS